MDKFWKDNKPDGTGKRKFEVVKAEMIKVLDKDGKPTLDKDDEPIKKATGKYTIQAKTITHWPKDGKQNVVKVLSSNKTELHEGHPAIDDGIGNGTEGIIHGSLGISSYSGNEGVVFYLSGVQIKDSTLKAGGGDDVKVDAIQVKIYHQAGGGGGGGGGAI